MSTLNAVAMAMYNKLTGGSALMALLSGPTCVYHMQASTSAALPYVVFNLQGGGAENITPSDMRNLVYFVRGYAATALVAGNIDTQISLLLHKQALTVSGYTNFWLARETDLAAVENPPDKKPIYMAGGLYRIRLDS
jgi:hypothetical protein